MSTLFVESEQHTNCSRTTRRNRRQPLRSLVMDAMGVVGEDTPEASEGVEVVDVDVATAATERLNPATTTERMLLRTARSLPKVRCATTVMLEVTSLPTAKLRYARSAVEGDMMRASVRPQRTWRLPLRWSCRVLMRNLRAGFMAEEVDAVCGHPQAHVASGKCDGSVPTCGVEGLAMQVGEAMEGWYFDTGASGHMSPSSEGMINFQPCNKSLRVANGATLPIEGKGNLVVEFQSGLESVRLQLHEVAYMPKLSYHLLSLSKAVEQGHKYIGDKNGLTMMLKSGKKLLVPNVRNVYLTYGYRPESHVEQACVVIAPGLLPTNGVDINHYHRTTAHTPPRLLRATAEQQGVELDPKTKLLPCVGCSAAKGLSARSNKTTECRSDKKMGRIFVDESGEKPVASKGGRKYSIIFRDDATRISWIYFMKKKSESPDALDQFLADTREYGPPRIIRTDDAPQLKAGKFDEICRKLHIKREFNSANTPQLNGVAERGLTLIEKVAKASAYQAKVSFVGMDLPPMDRLWTDNHHNACDVLTRSATNRTKE